MNNNSHPSNKFSNSINPDLEEKIPESLKSESFMLSRLEQREGHQTKPPINPSSGFKGNVNDPKQWTDFANALRIHKGGGSILTESVWCFIQTRNWLVWIWINVLMEVIFLMTSKRF